MHHCPSHARRRKLPRAQTLIAAAALKHHNVALRIETPHKPRNLDRIVAVSLTSPCALAGDIQHSLADIDADHFQTLAVHPDLHHVDRVRTEHRIAHGRKSPFYRSCSGPAEAGGPPDQHGRKDPPGSRGPAGASLSRRRRQRAIRGPSAWHRDGSRLCGAPPRGAAPRPGHECSLRGRIFLPSARLSYPRANIRASSCSTGATASIKRAAAASTARPAVSTTAEARAYSGSRLTRMLRNSAIAERSSAIGRRSPWRRTRAMCSSGSAFSQMV